MNLAEPRPEIDEFIWSDLLDFIEDGRVIPIVDTLRLPGADGEPIEATLARGLAQRLRIDLPEHGHPPQLDDVVRRHMAARGSKVVLYPRVLGVLKDLAIAPPKALHDLAAIDGLRLFVSVSPDGLLQRAIDDERHGGQPLCDTVAYVPNRISDLPAPLDALRRPLVFHLFGRLSATADSVICDDDRLEVLHALQEDALRPKLLFDALRDSHLLLLGCSLPDWAARFFLRAAKSERLSARRNQTFEYLVGPEFAADPGLREFLAGFSRETQLLPWTATDFIAELRRRWVERHPPGAATEPPGRADGPAGPLPGSVFISYSRADIDTARKLARAFEAARIDTWFDENELEAGDPWALKIQRGIRGSALFVPIVSADTQEADSRRRYFWLEWNTADDQAKQCSPSEVFILPVGLDGIDPDHADVPERFRAGQWTKLERGAPSPDFVARVLQLYREYHERKARPRAA